MKNHRLAIGIFLLLFPVLTGAQQSWFEGKLGIYMLYQYGYGVDPPKDKFSYPSSEQWNYMVESFDVERFANQMQAANLSYVTFFPSPRHSLYSAAPSQVFDSITGSPPGRFNANRDLLFDLATALDKRGMRLLIQWPFAAYTGRGATDDAVAAKMGSGRTLMRNRYAMLEEYARRYGRLLGGYWVYSPSYSDDELVNTQAVKMVKQYNPDAIVSICSSWNRSEWFKAWSSHQDYSSGESWDLDTKVTPESHPTENGMLWHLIVHLNTSYWKARGVPVPKNYQSLDTRLLSDYAERVTTQNGTLSMSIQFSHDGTIDPSQFAQLKEIGSSIQRTTSVNSLTAKKGKIHSASGAWAGATGSAGLNFTVLGRFLSEGQPSSNGFKVRRIEAELPRLLLDWPKPQ